MSFYYQNTSYALGNIPVTMADRKPCPICGHPTGDCTGDMIKPGATIIDVGITRVADETAKKGFRIKGDVHYASASEVASAITPVPGGVGLMTIAALLKNTMKAYQGL